MELTKQQAIEEHRKMWNWIAEDGWDIYKIDENIYSLYPLKVEYLNTIGIKNGEIRSNCFCCEYAYSKEVIKSLRSGLNIGLLCNSCPVIWSPSDYSKHKFTLCTHERSPFNRLNDYICDHRKIEEIADYWSVYPNLFLLESDEFKGTFKKLALEIANLPERPET